MKLAILGFAREGKSVLKFLKQSPAYKRVAVDILDQKSNKNYLKNLGKYDEVFRSPGVPYNLPEIQKAIKKGVRFSSVTKLFFSAIGGSASGGENARGNIIGITGTKGKGTTATLLYQILKNCGLDVVLAGNIGKSALEILPKLKSDAWVILELSSFQLQDLQQSPKIAVVLDIFPDHLDAHKNFREYINAKANIGRFQNRQDKIFYFTDNTESAWIAQQSPAKKMGIVTSSIKLPPIRIPGDHNRKNAAMAKAIALDLGCPEHVIDRIITNYRGMEHRLEFVRKVGNINFYNDSASTNPQTAAAAVLAFATDNGQPNSLKLRRGEQATGETIFIYGGKDKNLDYKPLAQAIKKSGNVKAVVLFGENKNKIRKKIRNEKIEIMMVKDLKSAVMLAYKSAKKLVNSSRPTRRGSPWTATHQLITIIFSPGSASFDMFKDYQDRGEKFKKFVKNLKN